MTRTDARFARKTAATRPGKRVERRMLSEAWQIRLLTKSHPVVLFLDTVAVILVICYLLGGTNPHRVLILGCSGVLVVRIVRQLRDKQHIPLNIVSKLGTVVYVAAAGTLIVLTAKTSNGATTLTAITAVTIHLAWRYLQWSLDITVLTHKQLWRIIGVATDDTPSMRFDTYGPTRVRRSTISKTLSGTPLLFAWLADLVTLGSLGSRLRRLSASLEYGDFIADGPSQQDAVLGWVHAVPRPYIFKSYVTGAQTTRPPDQSAATTQPLVPVQRGGS